MRTIVRCFASPWNDERRLDRVGPPAGQDRGDIALEQLLHQVESVDDFPDRDDKNWMKHTLAWIDHGGKTAIDYRPVHDYTMTNDVQYIPPKARVY